jgi:hypothetical protein
VKRRTVSLATKERYSQSPNKRLFPFFFSFKKKELFVRSNLFCAYFTTIFLPCDGLTLQLGIITMKSFV